MKFLLSFLFLVSRPAMAEGPAQPVDRILCYDRFEDQIWLMEGQGTGDDKGCIAMLIAGTLGICFEGDPQAVVDRMNAGAFDYGFIKVIPERAEVLTPDIIKFATYDGPSVGWTRPNNEMFRCPEFDKIKEATTALADQLESTVDYAVSRRYREEFGLPFWLQTEK